MDTFRLTKWYLDLVDDQGWSAIAYWARVNWGPLALGWEGLSLHLETGAAVHRSARAVGDEPAWSGETLAWRSAGLGVCLECAPWCAPFESRLFESADGMVEWSCQAPGATVTFDAGDGRTVRGTGYAERIVLTLAPWRLPISELRWGRWCSARTRRSLVWIDWRGERPLTLVLDGGCPRERAVVGDQAIAFADSPEAANLSVLRLDRPHTLYARTLSDVLRGLRPLAARLPAPWQAVEDRKTRSAGTLCAGEVEADTGWAIHEVVRLPGERVSP